MYITRYSCQILMKLEFSQQIFEKKPQNIKFEGNQSSVSQVGALSPWVESPERECYRSPTGAVEFKNEWSCTSSPAHALKAGCCRILPMRHSMMKYSVLWLDRELDPPDTPAASLILLSSSPASTWSWTLLEKPIILLIIFYGTEVYYTFDRNPSPDRALMKWKSSSHSPIYSWISRVISSFRVFTKFLKPF